VFVTMLRKLISDHQPELHGRARSISPAAPFATTSSTDYKANRAAMPDDLAEQINWVHEACEALGVPISRRRATKPTT
jgi:DNA polymerase-1